MSLVNIRRTHRLGEAEARAVMERLCREHAAKLGITFVWDGPFCRLIREGLSGSIRVEPKEVHIQLELEFPVNLARPVLVERIEALLDEHL